MQKNSQGYKIRIVQDMAEFEKLEPEWNMLVENNGRHVPFLCFDWFKVWLKYFLQNNKLFILLVYKEEQLLAIAPFMIRNEKFRGIISSRKIELLGNIHSPIRNFIFRNLSSGETADILSTLFNYLWNQYKNWDVIELDSIPEEDKSYGILKTVLAEHDLNSKEYFCFGDWYLEGINYSGDQYIGKLSRNTRREIEKDKRRINKVGHYEFQVGEDKDELDRYINIYNGIRNKSWKHPEMNADFLKDSREMAIEKGWLKFGFLLFNGSPMACQILIVFNYVSYFTEVVYDMEYSRFSPGSILNSELIKHLIDVDKITELDFGRGDDPYKKTWTPQRRERKGILIFNNNLKGQFLSFMMVHILSITEKNRYILAVRNKLSEYLKKRRQNDE